jgi:hypothetical protein
VIFLDFAKEYSYGYEISIIWPFHISFQKKTVSHVSASA